MNPFKALVRGNHAYKVHQTLSLFSQGGEKWRILAGTGDNNKYLPIIMALFRLEYKKKFHRCKLSRTAHYREAVLQDKMNKSSEENRNNEYLS